MNNFLSTFIRGSYFPVLVAVLIGVLLGIYFPEVGMHCKIFGDIFIKLIKMIVGPVIFCTVVSGIGHMNERGKIGSISAKTIIYFEVVTTLALALGLMVVHIIQPGKGLNININLLDSKIIENYLPANQHTKLQDFILNLIPTSFFSGLVNGEILQVLLASILFGFALLLVKEHSKNVLLKIDQLSEIFFSVVQMIMKVAPLGAFGAIAFTTSKFGFGALHALFGLMACVYITCLLFVIVILGLVLKIVGFNIFKFIAFIKEEIFLVFATSSSEAALPKLITKMQVAGCDKSITGLVIPTGYSFNLDGTSIYLTMAALFIAQATNIDLNWHQILLLMGIFMITSKGAAAVTGGGFVTLAAALSTFEIIPVAGIALLLGVDRFMSEARAVTNLVGNGVATLFIAKIENGIDPIKSQQLK